MTDPHDPGVPRLAHDQLNDGRPNPPSGASHTPIEPTATDLDPGSFRFDLDRALARLSEPQVPRFTWSSVTPSSDAVPAPPASSTASHPSHPAGLSPLPPGQPATPAVAPEAPLPVVSAFPDVALRDHALSRSGVEPLPEIQEATPVSPVLSTSTWNAGSAAATSVVEPVAVAPAAPVVVTGSHAFAAGAAGFNSQIPYAPNAVGVIEMPVGDGIPRLPESEPAAAPPMATMVAPTAVPSALKERANVVARKQRKRRRIRRYVMILIVLGGLAAGALVWGPGLLFPEDWDEQVVPTVEALQTSTGLEFDEPVGITALPSAEYAAKASAATLGVDLASGWTAELPRWRALGLAEGEPTVESVDAAVAAWMPAYYDAASGQIFRDASATGRELESAMRDALAAALVAEQDPEPSAPEPADADVAATPSLEALAVSDVRAELVAGTTEPDHDRLGELPVPLAHRLLAIEDLGAPILTSLGVTPDTAAALASFEDDVDGLLDVPTATAAPVPVLLEGDAPDGEAAARGGDFWFGVLAGYLPAQTAADAADAIGADLYTPAVRGDQHCVYGTFTPATPDLLPLVQIAAIAWAEAAPTQTAAQATTLADGTTVQLSTCDPGAAADAPAAPGVAAALVARQIARL